MEWLNLGVSALFGGRSGGRCGFGGDHRGRCSVSTATSAAVATATADSAVSTTGGQLIWVADLLLALTEERTESLLELAHAAHHSHVVAHHHLHLKLSRNLLLLLGHRLRVADAGIAGNAGVGLGLRGLETALMGLLGSEGGLKACCCAEILCKHFDLCTPCYLYLYLVV